MPRPTHAIVSMRGLTVVVLALALTSCAEPAQSGGDDPAQTLAAQQEFLEEQMPEIADAVGAPRVEMLRQTTCTGQYDPRTMGEIVEWSTSTGVNVANLDEARAVAAKAEPYLTAHGWTVKHADNIRPEAPLNELYTARHTESGLGLRALYNHGGGDSVLFLDGGGPCIDTPKGYQMIRSHLDLSFGDGTPEYDGEAERRSPLYTPQPTHSNPGPSTEEPGPATDG